MDINPFDTFDTDLDAAKEGVWADFEGLRFRIRSADCDEALKVIARQTKRQGAVRRANGGVLPTKVAAQNEAELAVALVTDWEIPPPRWWKGAVKDGKVPFSPETAKALLMEPRLVTLCRRINQHGFDQQNYAAGEIEAIEGNSSTASDGSSAPGKPPTASS